MEWLSEVASLGVGCVLAIVIFLMYRSDRQSSEERLTGLLEADQETRQENTAALRELIVICRNYRNGHGGG